jgi:hypothetical protein
MTDAEARAGENQEAIIFARKLIRHNEETYGKPHNSQVATITNAIYGTKYDKSNITQLRNRVN